jgi:hypothetical protein
MIADFGVVRSDTAVTRTIDNSPDNFVPSIGVIRRYTPVMDAKNKFEPCEKDGCIEGWHHMKDKAGNEAVIRCQCFHDYVARAS